MFQAPDGFWMVGRRTLMYKGHGYYRSSVPSVCCGSTALVALLRADSLHLAWLGDCRAVLCRGGKALDLTADHSLAEGAAGAGGTEEGTEAHNIRRRCAAAGRGWNQPVRPPVHGGVRLPRAHRQGRARQWRHPVRVRVHRPARGARVGRAPEQRAAGVRVRRLRQQGRGGVLWDGLSEQGLPARGRRLRDADDAGGGRRGHVRAEGRGRARAYQVPERVSQLCSALQLHWGAQDPQRGDAARGAGLAAARVARVRISWSRACV